MILRCVPRRWLQILPHWHITITRENSHLIYSRLICCWMRWNKTCSFNSCSILSLQCKFLFTKFILRKHFVCEIVHWASEIGIQEIKSTKPKFPLIPFKSQYSRLPVTVNFTSYFSLSTKSFLTFKILISSISFWFISLYSSDSVFSWFRTRMASPSMAILSVFTGLPGSRTEHKSENLSRQDSNRLIQNT